MTTPPISESHPAWARAIAASAGYDPRSRWWPALVACFWLYRLVMVRRVRVQGRQHIVPGPRILVSNHARVSDAFLLPFIFGRFHGMAQVEAFVLPVFGRLLAASGQVPVIPGRGREALRQAAELLWRGETILIYPEGRLTHGQGMLRGQTGAARLALETGAPLQPVAVHVPEKHTRVMHGRFYDRPTVGAWQFGGTAYVAIGEAWNPFPGTPRDPGIGQVRRATDEIMARVAALLEAARAAAG